jgi:uncharacterized protein (DUF433 family)
MAMHDSGESPEEIAEDFDYPLEAVKAVLEIRPYQEEK